MLCRWCKTRVYAGNLCDNCKNKKRIRDNRKMLKCRCGKKNRTKYSKCPGCREKNKYWISDRREYARKGYYCRECLTRHIKKCISLWYCPICLKKHRSNFRKNYNENK